MRHRYVRSLQPFGKELVYLSGVYAGLALALLLVFRNESWAHLFRFLTALFFLFFVPGTFFSLAVLPSVNFLARLVLGATFMMALLGLSMYLLGLLGIPFYSGLAIPPLVILLSVIWEMRNGK